FQPGEVGLREPSGECCGELRFKLAPHFVDVGNGWRSEQKVVRHQRHRPLRVDLAEEDTATRAGAGANQALRAQCTERLAYRSFRGAEKLHQLPLGGEAIPWAQTPFVDHVLDLFADALLSSSAQGRRAQRILGGDVSHSGSEDESTQPG